LKGYATFLQISTPFEINSMEVSERSYSRVLPRFIRVILIEYFDFAIIFQ
jgi:hypothetical protein